MAHNAKAGGEFGANGEWYKGGQFVADSSRTVKGEYRRNNCMSSDEWIETCVNRSIIDSIHAGATVSRRTSEMLWNSLSGFFGEVGCKVVRRLTLVERFSFKCEDRFSYYGGETWFDLMKFEDDDMNTFVWVTKSDIDLDVGQSSNVRFTIKGHATRNGQKQTKISHVKLSK